MAWVTVLGPGREQIEYRVEGESGCSLSDTRTGPDGDQVGYRLNADRPHTWAGNGLRDLGIIPGAPIAPEDFDDLYALSDGVDPHTGECLVTQKLISHPKSRLPAVPLLAALTAHPTVPTVPTGTTGAPGTATGTAGTDTGTAPDTWTAERIARLTRAVDRDGEAHRIPVTDAQKIADATGIDLTQIYPAVDLAEARKHSAKRVSVRNRGYDLTLDLPKSISVLYALADPDLTAGIEAEFTAAVGDTVTAMESWAGYGLRGHNGDGHTARRVDSSGLLGFVSWHHTARPVNGQPPDPHLHAHVTIFNLVHGTDGRWSAVGSGGRDILRHAHAADAFVKARLRHRLTTKYGVTFTQDPITGAWEIAGIPEALRHRFSKRDRQVKALCADLGLDYDQATTKQRKTMSARSKEAKQGDATTRDLRASWRHQAATDLPALINKIVLNGPHTTMAQPSPTNISARVFDPETGLTTDRKTLTRTDVFTAILELFPAGITTLAEAEDLTDRVLAAGGVVPLPRTAPPHLTGADRYTTQEILATEKKIIAAARHGYATNTAVLAPRAAARAVAAATTAHGLTLSTEQNTVVHRLLTAGHAVDAVIGVPGAGKTTLMNMARAAWQAHGLVVAGAATAAVAAANLNAESGIPATTIASWLTRTTGQGLHGIDVLVIDEAAMVDDRHLAQLLDHAADTGTKVILIGDPLQLKAIGIGGGFAAVHRQVGGLTLTENRRQNDPIERRALAQWRDHQRPEALRTWGSTGRIHIGTTPDDTLTAMITAWSRHRQNQPYTDVHDELDRLLILTGTNTDTDTLNHTARALRRAAGELSGPDHTYRLAGGGHISFAVGDHVRLRRNDYRTRLTNQTSGSDATDILNGYRGVIVAIDDHRNIQVEWRRTTPDGPRTAREWVTPDYIADGGLTHGTAMTIAAAQGHTAGHVLVYGLGADPHTLYSAMSRDQHQAHLYLPLNALETDTDRTHHGPPSDTDALHRALIAYATTLTGDRTDHLILTELGLEPDPVAPITANDQPEPADLTTDLPRNDQPAEIATVTTIIEWRHRPYGPTRHTDLTAVLAQCETDATRHAHMTRDALQPAQQAMTAAKQGNGPHATELKQRRATLEKAATAQQRIPDTEHDLTTARDTATSTRIQINNLTTQAARNPILLRLRGTTRNNLHTSIHDLEQAATTNENNIRTLETRLARYRQTIRTAYPHDPPPGPDAAAHDLAALTTGWNHQLDQAQADDLANATTDLDRATRTAKYHTTAAHHLTTRATQIREELTTRQSLPTETAHRENEERGAYDTQQAEHERAQETARHPASSSLPAPSPNQASSRRSPS